MSGDGVESSVLADLLEGGPSLWHDPAPSRRTPEVPSERLAVLDAHRPEAPINWLDRFGHRSLTWLRRLRRPTRLLRARAEVILARAAEQRALDDAKLKTWLAELAAACRLDGGGRHEVARACEEEAFAGVTLVVERVFGFCPHAEQLMGALALLEGRMAEMATGEGKTVTATMAAVVAAWRGMPCHVVTANDYLAERDARLGEPMFAWCGLSVASVTDATPPPARAAAYAHDVVYTTAKDLLGDYLRDRLAIGRHPSRVRHALEAAGGGAGTGGPVMRGIWQVIVDEADSVLIDEAVTPLIISAQRPDDMLEQAAVEAVALARQLEPGRDFRLQRALRHVALTEAGKARLGELADRLAPFWRNAVRTQELVEMALYALHMMRRDQHFVVEDDKVVLVDELTGRLARQRTLSLGMQQVLEASQDLAISPPSEVSARLSFQRFFRLFKRLGGMTGTAEEARGEFQWVYRLATLRIPTHRPVRRAHWPPQVVADEPAKFAAIAESAVRLVESGRAVLVGMRSVRSSEALYAFLAELKPTLQVSVLHAVNHAQESAIVAHAGLPGALTIATNMAGRGTDIVLAESVREAGGLHVILGESNDFGRIDRQLVGRCARQGDPGSVQRFIALDDELIQRFLPAWLGRVWAAQHRRWPRLNNLMALALLRLAQWRAARLAFKQRENILKQDIELDRIGL